MLKDLGTSDQFMKEYLKVRGDKIAERFENIEPHVNVLSSNCWPISQTVQNTVPAIIGSIHEDF